MLKQPKLIVENMELARLKARCFVMGKRLGLKFGDVAKVQMAGFSRDMMFNSPPVDKERAIKSAKRFSRNVFAPMLRDAPLMRKGKKGRRRLKKGIRTDIVWLHAGPDFILGTQKGNIRTNMSLDEMKKTYREKAGNKTFGPRYFQGNQKIRITHGVVRVSKKVNWKKRGNGTQFAAKNSHGGSQYPVFLQRTLVSRGKLKQFEKWLADSFGKLKGSWAVTYLALKPGAAIPAWIKKHIAESRSRGSRVVIRLEGHNPFIAITAVAKGVASAQEIRIINDQLRKRGAAVAKEIALYASGKKRLENFGKGIL